MTTEKVFDVAGKGTLTMFNSGGHVMIAEGNVKDVNGNDVYVVIGEEQYIGINLKNKSHLGYPNKYVDFDTYHDEVLGEKFYYGYEHDLQVAVVNYDYDKEVFTPTPEGLEVFGQALVDELVQTFKKFDKVISGMRGCN